MSELEKYLGEKRAMLDTETPEDAAIWEGIRERLRSNVQKKPSRIRPYLIIAAIAAAVILFFSIGYLTKDILGRRSEPDFVTLSEISQTLGIRETEYRTLVTMKSEEVKSFSSTGNMVVRELFTEIHRLDEVYDQSLKDLKKIGYNEKIVNTIFDTYEKKIHLLELIILETNKSESHENNGKINL